MVNDQELTNISSKVKNQGSGPKDESNTQNPLNATSDSITAISSSSSFSCSMGLASNLTAAAGSLLMPKKSFPRVSTSENVNSDETVYHTIYEDRNCYNDGISDHTNRHKVIDPIRNLSLIHI